MPEDEEIFLQYLYFQDLKDSYLRERDTAQEGLEEEAAKIRPERESEIKRGIRIDREHRKILNACIYPFASKISPLRTLGYYFLRAAPLLEKGVGNLDFSVYKKASNGIAIFGEAKGTVSDASAIIAQTVDRTKIVESARDYCIEHYLAAQNADFEYVLGVSSIDSNNVAKAVIRRGGGLIVWHSEKSPNPELTIHVPSDAAFRASMMHKEDALNLELGKKVRTSLEFKTFFQQSHTVAKLLVLLSIDKAGDGTFSYMDLLSVVEAELNYIDDPETIRKEVDTILTVGKSIGFVGDAADGRYRVRSKYKNARSRELDLIDKWVEFTLSRMEAKDSIKVMDELQSKYRKLREARTDLRRFFQD